CETGRDRPRIAARRPESWNSALPAGVKNDGNHAAVQLVAMAHNRFMGRTEPNFASFDEPGLKAAVRRAWGSEMAPESLRSKVSCLRSDHVAASQVDPLPAAIGSIRPSFRQQPW